MRIRPPRRIIALAAALALAAAGGSFALLRARDAEVTPGSANLARFASLSFGNAAPGALRAAAHSTPPPISPPDVSPIVTSKYLTPNGWLLRPAGIQIDTPRAPTGVTVSPDAKTAYVVNSGIFDEQLVVIDAETLARTLAPATDLYMGVAADGAGNVWAAGGNRNKVWQFRAVGPAAVGTRHAGLIPGSPNIGISTVGYPGNMVLGPGNRLFVAGNLSVPQSFIATRDSLAGACPNGAPAAKPICSVVNVIDVSNPMAQSPAVRLVPVGRDAYGLALKGGTANKLYVTNWADETNAARAAGTGTVSIVNLASSHETELTKIAVGHRPTGIALSPDGSTLVVANTGDDTITIFSVGPSGDLTLVDTKSVKTSADAPRGAAPIAVAFAPDGSYLFVALAGQNAVQVRNADGTAIPRTVTVGSGSGAQSVSVPNTYIPSGWFPSALATSPAPSGAGPMRLWVTNLKGIGGGPGFNGDAEPFMGSRTQGTVSAIDVAASSFDEWTATVVENNHWTQLFTVGAEDAASNSCLAAPLPSGTAYSRLLCPAHRAADGVDPHQLHVVYIVKENKTFDQYFGDIKPTLPDADADPTWLLYGEPVTTNQHNLARAFRLSDNFWSDAEVSVTGHSWTSAGYATEHNEITWGPEYDMGIRGHRNSGQYDGQFSGPTDSDVRAAEGHLVEPEERLVDVFADSDYTFRIYSDDVEQDRPAAAQQIPIGKWGIGSSTIHHGRDLDFPDTDRAEILLHGHVISNAWTFCGVPCTSPPSPPPATFGNDFALTDSEKTKFTLDGWKGLYDECIGLGGTNASCQSAMPNFLYVALPVDHTLGFNPYLPTPASMVANNDYAVGMIVDALSKSPFWKNTAIFVVEDDTQLAGDHVDSHRTFLLTAGGLARSGGTHVSHQAGSFPALLKTIETLFGLEPFTIYDRGAVPLHDVLVECLTVSIFCSNAAHTDNYDAVKPPVPFLRNPPGTTLAELSTMVDWRLDRGDPDLVTAIIYAGERGWPIPQGYLDMLKTGRRPAAPADDD
jgi:DNA-binding beta-propeller fold protein YncE